MGKVWEGLVEEAGEKPICLDSLSDVSWKERWRMERLESLVSVSWAQQPSLLTHGSWAVSVHGPEARVGIIWECMSLAHVLKYSGS